MEQSIWNHKGRIRRTTYWLRMLLSNIIVVAIYFIINAIVNSFIQQMIMNVNEYENIYSKLRNLQTIQTGIFLLGIIVFVYFQIAQGIKRMQDCDKSGWYLLIPVYSFILTLTEGTRGINKYGADPKGRGPKTGQGSW